MDSAQDYDVVVIGENLAGLWAAKQLLKLGKKVLIIPTATESGLNLVPREVAKEFNVPEASWSDRARDPVQVLASGRRVRLFSDSAQFQEELQFNFGLNYQQKIAESSEFLRGISYYINGVEPGPTVREDWSKLSLSLNEVEYFEKPDHWLSEHFLANLKREGATIAPVKSLKQIFVDRKNLVGVQLSGTSKMVSVQNGFFNTHSTYLKSYLNEKVFNDSIPMGWLFEVRFECSIDFLPQGLSSRLIYAESGAPILELIQIKPGKFFIRTTLPMTDTTLNRGEQRRLAERMLKVAEKILPDLNYNLKKVEPNVRDPERSVQIELPKLYPFMSLQQIPEARLVYGAQSKSGASNLVASLFQTASEVDPVHGVLGSFRAAKDAVDILTKRFQTPETGKADRR